MTTNSGEALFNLLPAIYRVRDAAQGERLRALLGVVESERQLLEDDIAGLYDNWYIETCAEWLVPYIGDLLGVRGLLPVRHGAFTQRAMVANTLAYRRAKGTAAVLEQLARDVTGWPAKAIEFFQRLVTAQHVNHIRPFSLGTVDLRDGDGLELLSGPFERANHTVEVGLIQRGQGRYNIPNLGIFLWRLQSYFIDRATARAAVPANGRYLFNPLGRDLGLFNRPRTETGVTQLAAEHHVPEPLRRRSLHEELEVLRWDLVEGKTPRLTYFGSQPVLSIFEDGQENPVPSEEIVVCHLGAWRRPQSRTYTRPDGSTFATRMAVDPVLGRMVFLDGVMRQRVEVAYAYGFSSDLGGGPYNREQSLSEWLDPQQRSVTWQIGVTQSQRLLNEGPHPGGALVDTLHAAVAQWNEHVTGSPPPFAPFGLIAVMDSATYVETLSPPELPPIEMPPGGRLAIVAAGWPTIDDPESPTGKRRVLGRIVPVAHRPHLLGDLVVHGFDGENPGELILDGLLIEGSIRVSRGNLGSLQILHCTVVPGSTGVHVEPPNAGLVLTVRRSISGSLVLAETVSSLRVFDSIIDGGTGTAISAPGSHARVESSTILGTATVHSLEASNVILTQKIRVARRQTGCVRFSYIPEDSLVPRRYHCQPDLVQIGVTVPGERARIRARLTPSFTSTVHGDPGYAQLGIRCPPEIRTGGEDGTEMGAFNHLQQPQREANLRARLEEYLPFGLAGGLFYAT